MRISTTLFAKSDETFYSGFFNVKTKQRNKNNEKGCIERTAIRTIIGRETQWAFPLNFVLTGNANDF